MRHDRGNDRRWSLPPRRLIWSAVLLVCSTVTLVSFQNCSQPVQTDEDSALVAEASKLDFAYDTTIDQIAYMSCWNMSPGTFDAGAYYTFRAGAYRSAGLRLSDDFRTAMGKKNIERQEALLEASPANNSTRLQFSMRARTNFQQVYGSSDSPKSGTDYMDLLEPLGSAAMCQELVEMDPAARMKYVRNGTVYGGRLEGSIFFTNGFNTAQSVRTYLNNDALLTLTYQHLKSGGSEWLARSPADVFSDSSVNPALSVYGRGYQIQFGQPAFSGMYGQFPSVVMSNVTERSLLNSSDNTGNSSWVCPSDLQFRIVRYDDIMKQTAGATNCVPAPDSVQPNQNLLKMARNSLRSEDWYIDMTNRCIIPKKPGTDCYGDVTSITYDMSAALAAADQWKYVSFASICCRGTCTP